VSSPDDLARLADLPATTLQNLSLDIDVTRALQLLSVQHREILVLRYFLDMSENEIGALLSRPAGTVKSRLARATRRFERNLPHD
jgi:RNA polymerase sigma factor (sigma-70 family)